MQMITDLEPERPGSGSDPTVGVLSYRIGFLALLGATILGAIGCVYGLLVGTTFGALSPWEWVTVPAMGILCGAFAILLLVTGERHLRRIAFGLVAWLAFYLLTNAANALYFLPDKVTAFVYLPWMMVLYGLMTTLLSARSGIRCAWAAFLGVAAIAVPLIVTDPEWRPGVEAGDALTINLFAQAAFIAMLYAMSTYRERYAASEARAAALLQEEEDAIFGSDDDDDDEEEEEEEGGGDDGGEFAFDEVGGAEEGVANIEGYAF